MAAVRTSLHLCFFFSASAVLLLMFHSQGLRPKEQRRHRRDELEYTGTNHQGIRHEEQHRLRTDDHDSTEFPAEHIDPAAIDLTPLVNTLINSSQSGSQQLFSLLSVTSYSSLALHKLTLLVYNSYFFFMEQEEDQNKYRVSSIKNIESSMFRRRFCYCVTNETNDLTDFTAILLDVMGNSTSYLHELFKSASILSVSQRNNSDCIYICVMAGQLGRDPPELWALDSITPLFNQTIVEGPHTVGNLSAVRVPAEWQPLWMNRSHMSPSVSRVHSTAHVSPPPVGGTSRDNMAAIFPPTPRGPRPTSQTNRNPTVTQAVTTPTIHAITATKFLPTSASASVPTFTPATSPIPMSIPAFQKVPGISVNPSPTATAGDSRKDVGISLSPRSASASPQPTTSSKHTAEVSPIGVFLTTHRPSSERIPGVSHGRTTNAQVTVTIPQQRTTEAPGRTTITSKTTERPGCPWRRPELSDSTAMLGAHKLQPCVFELCKFFSQCLCRPFGFKKRMKRYCADSHLWYQKHTLEVCRRVRRLSFSRNLKQRCLSKMCDKL